MKPSYGGRFSKKRCPGCGGQMEILDRKTVRTITRMSLAEIKQTVDVIRCVSCGRKIKLTQSATARSIFKNRRNVHED